MLHLKHAVARASLDYIEGVRKAKGNSIAHSELDSIVFHELAHIVDFFENRPTSHTDPIHKDPIFGLTNDFRAAQGESPADLDGLRHRRFRDMPRAHLLDEGISSSDVYRLSKVNDYGLRVLDVEKLLDGRGGFVALDSRPLANLLEQLAQFENGRDLLIQSYYANRRDRNAQIKLVLYDADAPAPAQPVQVKPAQPESDAAGKLRQTNAQYIAQVFVPKKLRYSAAELLQIAYRIAEGADYTEGLNQRVRRGLSPTSLSVIESRYLRAFSLKKEMNLPIQP